MKRKTVIILLTWQWVVVACVTNFEAATAIENDVKVITDFNSCFQQSMQKVKEEDSSLADLVSPDTDIYTVSKYFPKLEVNITEIPTEYNEDNSSEYPVLLNLTGDGNYSSFPEIGNGIVSSTFTAKTASREKIRYLLFTKYNKNQFQVMREDGIILGTKWRPERQTKVLVHGLTSTVWLPPIVNMWSQHIFEIKDAYLKKSADPNRYNVVVVDWTALSTVPLSRYPEAAIATQEAGLDLAEFLIRLREANNIWNWEDVHVLGHSLGAHVAGIAGIELRKRGYTLARITGLDPAGLCFDTTGGSDDDLDSMLDISDAKFVDIIHTNMGNIVTSVAGRYGSQMKAGHADFYPNGGEVQKGCTFVEDRFNFCSHQKSVVFYADSIWKKGIACPCHTWESYRADACSCNVQNGGHYMGEHCKPTARGKYYMNM